jgi:hypothetical protein
MSTFVEAGRVIGPVKRARPAFSFHSKEIFSMSSPFETSGSTAGVKSADDLLRELCGDEEAEAIIRNESEELATAVADMEASEAANEDDPAGVDFAAVQEAVAIAEAKAMDNSFCPFESTDEYLAAHRGQYFVWDLETVPDESRYPRPVAADKERHEFDLKKLQAGNSEVIVKELKTGLMQEDQLDELLQLENTSKKPRVTVAKEIMKAMNDLGSDYTEWQKKGSTDPWLGRIVAFSWSFLGEEKVHTMLARNAEEERHILAMFWALQSVGIRVGYNTKSFDDKFIFARSLILDVQPSVELEMGRYSKQSKDIMWMMFDSLADAKSCKEMARLMGIEVPAGDVEGKHVFDMVECGDWDGLAKYSNSDVVVEKAMFRMVKKYVQV